ncbi:MAG: response regulator transcription factor [Ghiorsea sp.]
MTNILIIEDDHEQFNMLAEYLGSANMLARCCDDGASGLAQLKQAHYDIVVLDIGLPDMDGFEVCRNIRSFSSVPVLILTARGDEMDRIIGLEIGADDYLAKPFNPRELLARIKAILRRGNQENTGSPAAPTRRFGRLEIHDDARAAFMDNQAITLTSYQFDLLSTLSKHAGRVLTRDQIMEAMKGHDLEAFDRSIDVHISRIRAQIEDDVKKPKRILTIRGVGYVFAKEQD